MPIPATPSASEEFNRLFASATKVLQKRVAYGTRGPKVRFWNRRSVRQAIADLHQCITIEPRSWQAMWFLGKAHQAMTDDLDAFRAFKAVILTFPPDSPTPELKIDLLREAAIAAEQSGQTEAAIHFGESAIELSPADGGLRSNLAIALHRAGRHEEAIAAANEGCRLSPSDSACVRVLRVVSRH